MILCIERGRHLDDLFIQSEIILPSYTSILLNHTFVAIDGIEERKRKRLEKGRYGKGMEGESWQIDGNGKKIFWVTLKG